MLNIDNLWQDVSQATKLTDKQAVLRSYAEAYPELVKMVLSYCYDPNKLFHCTFAQQTCNMLGNKAGFAELAPYFFTALDACERELSSAKNRANLQALLNVATPGAQRLMLAVINKDMKAGLGEKTVLDMFPRLFLKFNCQLAKAFDPDKSYAVPFWYVSTKLDGLRCVALYLEGTWKLFTREGARILTCDHLFDSYEKLRRQFGITFLDGELYNPNVTFEQIQSYVMSRTDNLAGRSLHHAVWSFGDADDFLDEDPQHMKIFATDNPEWMKVNDFCLKHLQHHIWPVRQEHFPNNNEKIMALTDEVVSRGCEGVMLRHPYCLYDFKRSELLLKAKKMKTMDGVITEVNCGELTRKVAGGGNVPYRGMQNITIRQEDNGAFCNVGSGWTIEQRVEAFEHPERYIGRTIEVQYQNLTNTGRCRFPVFKNFRLDKTVR